MLPWNHECVNRRAVVELGRHGEGAEDKLPRPFVSGGSAAAQSHLATAFFSAEPADTLTP